VMPQVMPPAAGETQFASTVAAYAALPAKRRAQLDGLVIVDEGGAATLRCHLRSAVGIPCTNICSLRGAQ
jgi:alpha-ketoglutarate-dependent taurine dioxygenase